MKLIWTNPARVDRKDIRETIAQGKPAAALALDELILEKSTRLVDHPKLGHQGRITGTRELVAHENYILIYDLTDDEIRILRVLHADRQWPPTRAKKRAKQAD